MECGFVCDLDLEPPEFICVSLKKARKNHKCCECGEIIPAGNQYQYISGKWDGDFLTFKTCATCAAIRSDYCCCYGDLRTDLWQALGLDYVTGKTIDDTGPACDIVNW